MPATNTTFASLVTDLQRYLERGGSALTDPTVFAQLPRLINAAERKMADYLKLLGQIEVLVDASGFQTAAPVFTLPDRWRATASLQYGTGAGNNTRRFIFPRSLEYAQSYWPDTTATAPPEIYAEMDLQHYLIVPTPDQTYPIQLTAWMLPVLLCEEVQQNFWTNYAPDALLYSALVEAEPFLKNDDRLQTWKERQSEYFGRMDAQDAQRIMDRASQRMRP